LLKRIALSTLTFAIAYYALRELGVDTTYAVYAYVSYLTYEILGLKFSRFRSPLLAVAIFFVLKVLAQLPIPYNLNLPDFDLLMFLIGLSLVWIDSDRLQPILSGVGLTISAYFGYTMLSPFGELRILLVIVLVILALTTVLPVYIKGLIEWRNFLIATTVISYSYFAFVRPILSNRPGLISLFDWVLVLAVFLKALSKVRMTVTEGETFELHRRSEVGFEEMTDEVERAKGEFLERGNKTKLLVVLIKYLSDLSVRDLEVIVEPLVKYQDRRIPKLAFNWEKRRILKENLRRREEILREITRRLGEVKA